MPLPVVHRCDVVIIGGGAPAVALALALRERGRSVLVAAPRPYLGDDIVGAVRFWADPAEASVGIARELFVDAGRAPSPLHAKRILAQALAAAGIPLLLLVQPAGLLLDRRGRAAGVVVADRAGLQVVRARAVVDASERGLLGDAAGCARSPWTASVAVRRALVSPDPPTVAGATVRKLGMLAVPSVAGVVELPGWELAWEAPCAAATATDLARLDAATAAACWHPRAVLASERVEVAWPDRFVDLDAAGRAAGHALWVLGPCGAGAERGICAGIATAPATAAAIAAATAGPADADGDGDAVIAWPGRAGVFSGEPRVPEDGLRPGASADERIAVDLRTLPLLAEVDVVVAGGGTGGAPAGIAAARAGARTIVLELMHALGGVGTVGQICRYWFGNRVGFTAEVDRGWATLGASCPDLLARCVGEGGWHPDWKARWLRLRLGDAGGCAWLGWATVGAVVADARVTGIVAAGPWGVGVVAARCCVDASGSADVAAAAGAPTESIGAEHVAVQGTGLGPKDPDQHYRNTDRTFVDDNDVVDVTRAHLAALGAFAGAFDVGQLVDTRERRRIRGVVAIQPEDILRDRAWADTIARATSNFDTHGFTVHPLFLVEPMHEDALWADIPLRALLPRGVDGILVTGLAISAHRDALPVIRMQADVQNQGYAAGRAAALAAERGGRVRAIDFRELQRHLVAIGSLAAAQLVRRDEPPSGRAEVAWAVRDGLDLHVGIAVCLANPDHAAPLLRAALVERAGAPSPRVAMLLGLLGDAAAEPALIGLIAGRAWDDGWNFRGMGQFGRSSSELDGLVIALGRCGGDAAVPVLAAAAATLAARPDLSHCRAIGEAVRLLAARGIDVGALAPALASTLRAVGDAARDAAAIAAQPPTTARDDARRNRGLRELILAAALRRAGDDGDLAAATLRAYADADSGCGPYRRHALAVLAEPRAARAAQSPADAPAAAAAVARAPARRTFRGATR